MTNKTEEVYLLEIWTHDSWNLNYKDLEQTVLLQDPYDSVWLKFIAVLSYFICLLASAIMLAFIQYEKGHHGNFRTVINQLLSNLYLMGIFYAIVISGLRVLRVCYGPLPIFLCNITGFLNACSLLFAVLTIAMYTFTRFMFVCIWKRMRQMDDNLIVRIASIQAIVMTLFFQAASWSGSHFQGQPPACTGILLNPSPNVAKQRFSMLGHILLPCLVITIGLMIAIKKKRSTENDINQQGPKNLDSLLLNSVSFSLLIYSGVFMSYLKGIPQEKWHIYPTWLFLYIHEIILPVIWFSAIGMKILMKKEMKRFLFGNSIHPST